MKYLEGRSDAWYDNAKVWAHCLILLGMLIFEAGVYISIRG